jgi:DNA replication protein DnaC
MMISAADRTHQEAVSGHQGVMTGDDELGENTVYRVYPCQGFLVARTTTPLSEQAEAEELLAAHTLHKSLALFNAARIPAVFEHALVTHRAADRQATPCMERAVRWLNRWTSHDPFAMEGIILSGHNGIGKSFALAAILRFMTLRLAIPAWFVSFNQLLHDFKACYQGDGHEFQLWDRLRQCPVLALDDVASGRSSDWARDILQTIIAFRYNACATTLLTTHLPFEPVSATDTRPTLRNWVGAHCYSRFKEMCYFLPVIGLDRRQNALRHNEAVTALIRHGTYSEPARVQPRAASGAQLDRALPSANP